MEVQVSVKNADLYWDGYQWLVEGSPLAELPEMLLSIPVYGRKTGVYGKATITFTSITPELD